MKVGIVINVTVFIQGPTRRHRVPSRYVRASSSDFGELLIWNLSSYRMPSTPKSTLQTLLKSSASSKLHECLLDALETASDTELEVLAALLAPLSAHAGVKKHCVRCHLTYTENKNHSSACKIKHNDEGETDYDIGCDEGITTLNCCGISFGSEDEPDTTICFSAPHTTDVDDVLYYESANDDEDDVNTNVIRCEVKPSENELGPGMGISGQIWHSYGEVRGFLEAD